MSDRAVFTKSSAERIARVVRRVEAGDRNTGALPTAPRFSGAAAGKVFRIAKFTGSWAIDTQKTVTFANQTNTPNTAVVENLFFPFPDSTATVSCAIAREGTAWYLIDVPLETATAAIIISTQTALAASSVLTQSVVASISLSATLNTNTCAITLGVTQTTAAINTVDVTATAEIITEIETVSFIAFKVA